MRAGPPSLSNPCGASRCYPRLSNSVKAGCWRRAAATSGGAWYAPARFPTMVSPNPSRPARAPGRAPSMSLRARRRPAANQQWCGGAGGSRRAAGSAMEDVCAKFVSQKISKARWRPLPATALQPPDIFATGSWDNEVASQ